jgi:predicted helicase
VCVDADVGGELAEVPRQLELHDRRVARLVIDVEVVFDEATEYEPFPGLVLTDTLQSWEDADRPDLDVFPENNQRLERLKALDIQVIIGNPPWSVGQDSANDENANEKYPTIDTAIHDTYAVRSTATLKNSLYDSYIRAIKWAALRIKDRGVIAYVTNGGWLDSNTADGMRLTLATEFSDIYIYNLRGNRRNGGAEGRPIWEAFARNRGGSISAVAIVVLVKDPSHKGLARVHYNQVSDYTTATQKVEEVLEASSVLAMKSTPITPNKHGDWLNQRRDDFDSFPPLSSKDGGPAVFDLSSGGLKTNRDSWCYNSSRTHLERNIRRMVSFYNAEVDRIGGTASTPSMDPTKFSWDRADRTNIVRRRKYSVNSESFRVGQYRPFTRQAVCFDRSLNNTVYRLYDLFPTNSHSNIGFTVTGVSSHYDFCAVAADDTVRLTLIMIYFANTNTRCGGHGHRTVTYFVIALAK